MAEISYQQVETPYDGTIFVYQWVNITENDTCRPLYLPIKSDKTIQVKANSWGSGGTLTIKGAIYTTFDVETLTDVLQDPVVFNSSSAKIKTILENTYVIQPVITAGTGVSLTIGLCVYGR